MNFEIKNWSLAHLVNLTKKGKINLNPPYQRNPVWTLPAQKELIDTIRIGFPLPCFFVHLKADGKFDMVDGQQRTRAVVKYIETDELNFEGEDSKYKKSLFTQYRIPVVIINTIPAGIFIEDFYYRVNKYGLRLNRPEELKSKHHNTRFLDLVQKLVVDRNFTSLEITSSKASNRMLDRDLVEELCVLIKNGITDKKDAVDELYKHDINWNESRTIANTFNKIIFILHSWNSIKPIKETRYRQRNDIYTLFSILRTRLDADIVILNKAYRILLAAEPAILPHRNGCKPLSDYAFHCITQSNSKHAREDRLRILSGLLFGEGKPTDVQKEVLQYFNLDESCITSTGKYKMFETDKIAQAIEAKQDV